MSPFLRRQILICCASLLIAAPVTAATFTVNRLNDAVDINPDDGICDTDLLDPGPQCTLRAAIMTANASPGPDSIELPANGIFQLSLSGAGGAEAGDLNISDALDIVGFVGVPPVVAGDLPLIDAAAINDRIFSIAAGVPVTLRGLRLRGGDVIQGGGAILSAGQLQIEHSEFAFNTAARGGAIRQESNPGVEDLPPPPSSLVVRDSHFELNHATLEGGAVHSGASILIERSSFRDNRADEALGSTLHLQGSSASLIDSTLDGASLAGPIAGLAASVGIVADGVFNLIVRNATVTGFSLSALELQNLSSSRHARIGNTILAGGMHACRASGPNVAAADVLLANSLVQSNQGCDDFYQSIITGVAPQLGGFANDPGSLTWYRAPTDLFSNLVDTGIAPGATPVSPELGCSDSDQRGNARPQDGNGDDIARCDLGAVELGGPLSFVVDSADDAVDDVPGDARCESISGLCTLRAAVMEANALPGAQRIRFASGIDTLPLQLPASPSASGGDLDLTESLIISGNVADGRPLTHIQQGVPGERLFDVGPAAVGPLILRGLRLSGGDSGAAFAGALRVGGGSVTVESSELFDNVSSFAGGAVAVVAGTLNIIDSDLHANSTDERGGAAFVGSGATLRITGSSLWNNQSVDGDLVALAAIHVEAGGALALVNSTIAENSAGLLVDAPSYLGIVSSTIAENTGFGIDAQFAPGNLLALATSIIADNGVAVTAKSLSGVPGGSNCRFGNLNNATTLAHEFLLGNDDSCFANAASGIVADPLLQPLGEVPGRNTRVMWPLYEVAMGVVSPALDAAPANFCLPVDQLGGARSQDLPDVPNLAGACDLGAVEIQTEALFSSGFESD